jgi:hypothetical protein
MGLETKNADVMKGLLLNVNLNPDEQQGRLKRRLLGALSALQCRMQIETFSRSHPFTPASTTACNRPDQKRDRTSFGRETATFRWGQKPTNRRRISKGMPSAKSGGGHHLAH